MFRWIGPVWRIAVPAVVAIAAAAAAFRGVGLRASADRFRGLDRGPRGGAIARELGEREGSFRRLLCGREGQALVREFEKGRPGCGETVRGLLLAGESFYSSRIDQAAVPLGTHPKNSGVQDDLYFHVTRSESFMESFRGPEGAPPRAVDFERIFVFLRTREKTGYAAGWGRVFYVAEDLDSIRWFAPWVIEFRLDPASRLVELERQLWTDALSDVVHRMPALRDSCGASLDIGMNDVYATVDFHPLVFLIAEESGVDVVDYGQAGRWFQVVTSRPFLGARPLGRNPQPGASGR